jgi:predicted HTH domain antitoxin
MSTIRLELDDDIVALLNSLNQPLEESARELIILELYRRGLISSGKAAEILSVSKASFIQHAGQLGIPYLSMTKEEWDEDCSVSDTL